MTLGRLRSEHGAAAVELALVLLPLLLLLFGIVEFSRAYYMQLRLQHAASEAARVIALHDPLLGDITPTVESMLVDTLSIDDIGDLDEYTIKVCGTSPPDDTAEVVLKRNVPVVLFLPDGVGPDSVLIAGAARMRCEV